MNSLKIKKEIIRYSKLLNTTNLSPLRSGNISVRYKNGFFITPSGKKYSSLRVSDIVFVSLEGRHIKKHTPSSEWRFHRDIYKAKKYSGSIVHCHSHNALILSCLRKKIPPFHYMVAVAGGEDIRCAKYDTFGTSKLSKNIIISLKDRKACLIENHGQVAFDINLSTAFELAQEVEYLASQYIDCLRVGKPKLLSYSLMRKVLKKVKNYKKGDT